MTNMVEKAFLFALKVHGGQTRKDGKPYITPVSYTHLTLPTICSV